MSAKLAKRQLNTTDSRVMTKGAIRGLDYSEFDTLEGWEPKEGCIYSRTRAISARVNQNFDGWPSEELKKSYKTFLGKPVFVNHVNDDPRKARGRVVASRYVEDGDDKYIEVIQEVNAEKFPKLAHELITGGLDSVSMGCEAKISTCSYCGNVARDVSDMCDHVLRHKGEVLTRRNALGEDEEVLVYEECRDIGFFELSYVFDPADETALVSNVVTANKKQGYGETLLPPHVDTLRSEEEDVEEFFIDPPEELEDPDLSGVTLDDSETEEGDMEVESSKTPHVSKKAKAIYLSKSRRVASPAWQDSGYGELYYVEQGSNEELATVWSDPTPQGLYEWTISGPRGVEGEGEAQSIDEAKRQVEEALNLKNSKKENRMSRRKNLARRRRADQSRNDQGEAEETFVSETPAPEPVDVGDGEDPKNDTKEQRVETEQNRSGRDNLAKRRQVRSRRARQRKTALNWREDIDEWGEGDEMWVAEGKGVEYVIMQNGSNYSVLVNDSEGYELDLYDTAGSTLEEAKSHAEGLESQGRYARKLKRSRRKASGVSGNWYEEDEGTWTFYPDDMYLEMTYNIVEKDGDKFNWAVGEGGMYGGDVAEGTASSLEEAQAAAMEAYEPFAQRTIEENREYYESRRKKPQARRRKAEQADDFDLETREDVARDVEDEDVEDDEHKVETQPKDAHLRRTRRARRGRRVAELVWTEEEGISTAPNPNDGGETWYEVTEDTVALMDGVGTLSYDSCDGIEDGKAQAESWAKTGRRIRKSRRRRKVARGEWRVEKGTPVDTGTYFLDTGRGTGVVYQRDDGKWDAYFDSPDFDEPIAYEETTDDPNWMDGFSTPEEGKAWVEGFDVDQFMEDLEGRFASKRRSRRKASVWARRRKAADVDLEVARPDGRVDVERPVEDTTDDEAQESQFDKEDFGNNAGDDKADPDLSTDQNWAPGEGKRTSRFEKKASQIQALKLAEAMADMGLESIDDRWKLAEAYTKLPEVIIRDRIALLEKVSTVVKKPSEPKVRRARRTAQKSAPEGFGSAPTLKRSSVARSDDYSMFF